MKDVSIGGFVLITDADLDAIGATVRLSYVIYFRNTSQVVVEPLGMCF